MSDLKCVVCDSTDPDLLSLKLPIRGEKRPIGIIYCCKGCKAELVKTIHEYAETMKIALEAMEREDDGHSNIRGL